MDRVKLLIIPMMALLLAAPALADTIIFDGFETGSLGSNWSVFGVDDWTVMVEDPYNGTYHAGVSGPGGWAYLELNISTETYNSVNVTYYRQLNGLDGIDDFMVQWSDGTTYTTLEQLGGEAENGPWEVRQYALPAGAADNIDFSLRFGCDAGAISEDCFVDDVHIEGFADAPDEIDPVVPGGFTYNISNGSKGFAVNVFAEYEDNGSLVPVNTSLVPSTETVYEWGVTTGLYEAHFKNLPSTTASILIRRGIEIAYDPNGIYWDSTSDDDIIDANPGGAGDKDPSRPNVMLYPDAYGTGIDIEYHYLADSLKEYVVVDNRAALGDPAATVLAGENVTLKLEFALHNTNDADIYVDGQLWTSDGVLMGSRAELKDGADTVFILDTPYAFDSNGSEVEGWYQFKRSLGDLWVEQHIPFDWVNSTSTVYPIYVDPTTEVEVDDTVVINLSDETYDPLRQIVLYNVSDNGENYLLYDNLGDNIEQTFSDEYAIDPSHVDFTSGVVLTKNASGDELYKCVDWNMTSSECYGDWFLVDGIIKGEQYNFTLTAEDPGFAEYELDPNETTTTSTSWVNASVLTFNVTRAGDYLVMANWQQRGSSTGITIHGQVVLDGTTISEFERHPKSADPTKQYPAYLTHDIDNLSVGEHTLLLQHKVTGVVATSYIKGVTLTSFDAELDDFPIEDAFSMTHSPNTTTLTSTWQNITVQSYTPELAVQYLHLGSIEGSLSTAGNNVFGVRWWENDKLLSSWDKNPEGNDDWYQGGFAASHIEAIALDTMYVEAYTDTAGTGLVRRAKMETIGLLDLWDPHYANNETQVQVTGKTYVSTHELNFTPEYAGNTYMIIGNAEVSSSDGNIPNIIQMTVNGSVACEVPIFIKSTSETDFFFCNELFNVGDLSTVNVQFQIKTNSPNKNVEIENQYITAFRFTPQEQELLCYPRLNYDWYIEEPIICDNVTRTTGTGQTHIAVNGSLSLINNAVITTNGFPTIARWMNPYMISIERGSDLITTH